jgi:hypothetical protein
MFEYEVFLVTAVICGGVCAWIAKARGRSPVLWFFVGAVLNVFVLLAVLWKLSRNGALSAQSKGN